MCGKEICFMVVCLFMCLGGNKRVGVGFVCDGIRWVCVVHIQGYGMAMCFAGFEARRVRMSSYSGHGLQYNGYLLLLKASVDDGHSFN